MGLKKRKFPSKAMASPASIRRPLHPRVLLLRCVSLASALNIACHAVAAVADRTGTLAERVPDRDAAAVRRRGALDLERCARGAEREPAWLQWVTHVTNLEPDAQAEEAA